MGKYGKRINGKEIVEHVTYGYSFEDGKPKHRLNDCPMCGAKQYYGNDRLSPVYSMFCGTGNFGGWFVICHECGYAIQGKDEEDAVAEWNFDYLY